jgi:hypothetical protein
MVCIELIAVHGLFGKQPQQRSAHISTLRSPAFPAVRMATARSSTADRRGLNGEVRVVALPAGNTTGSTAAVTK